MRLTIALLIGCALHAFGCSQKISVFPLSNGDALIEYDGQQWQVRRIDVARAKENIGRYGLPYAPWTEEEKGNWFGCEAVGGLWHESDHRCVWHLGTNLRRIEVR